jgi:hypothetical protein
MGFRALPSAYVSDMGRSEKKIIRARADKLCGESYNLCHETSFKLMDDLQTGGFDAQMLKCQGLKTDAPDADDRWMKLAPQSLWIHFVVRVGEDIIDLTRRQFFPESGYPFIQSYADFEAEWSNICVPELRSYMMV